MNEIDAEAVEVAKRCGGAPRALRHPARVPPRGPPPPGARPRPSSGAPGLILDPMSRPGLAPIGAVRRSTVGCEADKPDASAVHGIRYSRHSALSADRLRGTR